MRVGALRFDAGHEFTHRGAGVVFGQSLAGCEVETSRWMADSNSRTSQRGNRPYDRACELAEKMRRAISSRILPPSTRLERHLLDQLVAAPLAASTAEAQAPLPFLRALGLLRSPLLSLLNTDRIECSIRREYGASRMSARRSASASVISGGMLLLM
jgi:hypothetical protein